MPKRRAMASVTGAGLSYGNAFAMISMRAKKQHRKRIVSSRPTFGAYPPSLDCGATQLATLSQQRLFN
jgi:hypothetical protein